jgi:hypothetical protein
MVEYLFASTECSMNRRPKVLILGAELDAAIEDRLTDTCMLAKCSFDRFRLSKIPNYADYDLIIVNWEKYAFLIALFLRAAPQFPARLALYSGVMIDHMRGVTPEAIMDFGLFDFFLSKLDRHWSSHIVEEMLVSIEHQPPRRDDLDATKCAGYLRYGWRTHCPFGIASHTALRLQSDGSQWWQESYGISQAFERFPSYFEALIMKESKEYLADPIWGRPELEPGRTDNCFVLMPFREPFSTIYRDHILPVVERLNFRCLRADDFYGPNAVMRDVWNGINNCRFLIAELSSRNPNVMYELGIAHTIGKEVILICQDSSDVPFDFQHLRYFRYDYTPRGCAGLEENIERCISQIIKNE